MSASPSTGRGNRGLLADGLDGPRAGGLADRGRLSNGVTHYFVGAIPAHLLS
jgi:hypothetical protein